MLSKLKNTEIERNKLARELRTLTKRNEINALNLETTSGLAKIISEEKERQEIYLSLLMQSWSDIIFIFDQNLKFLLGTKSITNVIDVEDVSVLKKSELRIILERYRPQIFTSELVSTIEKISHDAKGAGEKSLELTIANRHYKVSVQPFFKETKEYAGIMVIMYDLTEIMEAKHEAEQASRVKTDFLSSMSHEIRTPMNAIIGMTELALRSDSICEAREQMGIVKQASAKLLAIINDILDFSKIEKGRLSIARHEYQLASLVNDVVSIIRMRALDLRLIFVVNLASKTPAVLIGDETRIRQVLLNILGNAVKYTKEGYISLELGFEAFESGINLIMEISDSGLGIKEEDLETIFDAYVQSDYEKNKHIEGTGLGLAITKRIIEAMGGHISVRSQYGVGSTFSVVLPQEVASSDSLASIEVPVESGILVFERREINSRSIIATLEDLGVECGAANNENEFAQKLLEKDWGIVFVASGLYSIATDMLPEGNTGPRVVVLTDFGDALPEKSMSSVAMPLHCISVANILNGVPDRNSLQADIDSLSIFAAPEAKVLVVDDIVTNLKVAEGLLKPYQMQVDLRDGGLEAIEAVQEKEYDLVLMDHRMPKIDGIETTLRIRALAENSPNPMYFRNLPIIALTANAIAGMEDVFLANGFDSFLSKPIDTIKLNALLKKWVPKHKQRNNASISKNIVGTGAINIQGLDTEKGVMRTGGTAEMYFLTLKIFYKEALRKVQEIQATAQNRDLALFTTHVHGMKSAGANIGAIELSSLAGALEEAGKEGNWAYIDLHAPIFLSAMGDVLENISAAISEYHKGQGETDCNLDDLRPGLEALKAALSEMDINAIDRAAELLNGILKSGNLRNDFDDIEELILAADFGLAIEKIDDMLG